MWVYVDESGCLGMKLGQGSSPFFCVVSVLFKDKAAVTACYNRIEALKSELKIRKEFHFRKTAHLTRLAFFREMRAYDFQYFGLAIDKSQIHGFSRPFLHNAVLTSFSLHAESLKNATVVIDRTGSDEFRKMMSRSLKNDLNRQFDREVIRKVKNETSHANNLLQLADMVAGAVTRSLTGEKNHKDVYREIIRGKELRVTIVPASA